MAGTVEGGTKASITNKKRYGEDFYRTIGGIGGRAAGSKGFASENVGSDGLTGRQRAKIAGSIGGRASRRVGGKYESWRGDDKDFS